MSTLANLRHAMLTMMNSLLHATDAAERLRKISLEKRLVARLADVCSTYNMGPRMKANVAARQERLRIATTAIKLMVEHLIAKD